jgi:hypothetical protein
MNTVGVCGHDMALSAGRPEMSGKQDDQPRSVQRRIAAQRHDYTICDGLCVPDECVCPSVEQRTAEVKAAVAAERARIRQIIEDRKAWHPDGGWILNASDLLAALSRNAHGRTHGRA